ncbi:MAG: hypothetical protein NTZ59_05360 [Bacteroidetes bacterium]|nr:hypothetical protein [Bacteroidota bacterium]
MKRLFFAAFALTVVLMACTKTENPATTYLPLTKYNVAGTYKITALTFTPNSSLIEYDVYNIDTIFKACQKDDLLIFDTNYVFNYADSGTQCSMPQNYTGVYVISSPNLLAFEGENFIVQSLSTTNLVITQSQTLPFLAGNIMGILKSTLTKQP